MKTNRFEKKWIQCLIYTVLFVIMSFIIYAPFWKNGKTFIWMVDGWSQHYKAMLYYKQWMETILDNIFVHHTFEIPMYSFSIGYGSDILTTLNYYIIGDPLGLIALFTPEKYMVHTYNFLMVLRIYLAGLAFIFFCYQRGHKNCIGILCGTFSYIFCGYVLYAAIRHPFFVNPMIYFPLLLIGVEKILNENKSGMLIGVTAIAAMSNFYFLYMLAIMTGLYTIFRVMKMKCKAMALEVLKIAGYAFVGVLVAGVILVPIVLAYLGDNRIGIKTACDVLWGIDYYKCFFQNFSGYKIQEEYGMLGFTMTGTLIGISWFLNQKKEDVWKKVFVLVLFVFALFPIFASALNGFSYASNRYVWALNMMLSYGIVCEWEHFLALDSKKAKILGCIVAGYCVCCILLNVSLTGVMWKNILLALFAGACLLIMKKWNQLKTVGNVIVFAVVLLSIANNGMWAYDIKGEYDARLFVSYDMLENGYGTNETAIVKENRDAKIFGRYTSNNVTFNTTLQNGLHSTQYFWSLSNPFVTSFLKEMAVIENTGVHRYSNLDDRLILNNLLSVRYYVDKKKDENLFVPYGYEKVSEDEYYQLYINDNVYQMSSVYDGYVRKSEYDKMNPIQKQEICMQAVVVNDEDVSKLHGMSESVIEYSNEKYDCKIIETNNKLQIDGNRIEVLESGAQMVIAVDGICDAENYVYIEGLQFQEVPNSTRPESANIKFMCETEEGKGVKTLTYTTEQYLYYQDKHDFVINMGYKEGKIEKISIAFDIPGVYSYEKLEVYGQPVEAIAERTKALQVKLKDLSINDENAAFATNRVLEEIELQKDGIVVLAIPYGKGWNAYVDGNKARIIQANTMCMAIPVLKGNHRIELKYRTYGSHMGIGVSIVGIIVWIVIIKKDSSKRKKAFHETKIS